MWVWGGYILTGPGKDRAIDGPEERSLYTKALLKKWGD